MSSTELLADDFLKNLLENLPKEENVIPEKKSNNENNIKFQNFISNSSISQLKDLKNLLKSSANKELGQNDTINNCLIYPKILDINNLLEKIFYILDAKSNNEIL